jgi:HAD superfamily hydrolase (TIGR01450 family)
VDQYDGLILDQFGVMHNGESALDGAPECIRQLKARNKRLIILSNSSSLSSAALGRLGKLGLDANDFVGAVTSGQEASQYIRNKYQNKKALFFTWKSSMDFLAQCGIQAANSVDEADFVLLHGCEVLRGPERGGVAKEIPLGFFESGNTSLIEPILELCRHRNLELICCNPDYTYISPDGRTKHMPGKISEMYRDQFHGTVHNFGKPHRKHFEACVRMLGLPKERICHVGDSLHHDIKGANDSGVASIFVSAGVHKKELGVIQDEDIASKDCLDALFTKHGHTPTHVVPMFQF